MIAPDHQGCTLDTLVTPWAELIHRTRVAPWAELLSAFQAVTVGRCICRWECAHYQNHIPSPWLQHVTMIAPDHQGCTLDTMVTPWAELIHRTRITPWAELLSAFQAAWVAADSGHR